jgi:hypothetical protein
MILSAIFAENKVCNNEKFGKYTTPTATTSTGW